MRTTGETGGKNRGLCTMKANQVTIPTAKNPLAAGVLVLGRYQIEEVIGVGGMGAVYRARDSRFRESMRPVAVKEMLDQLPGEAARRQAQASFEREANILASLNHPAIPKVYDFFTEGERHYLVMEYVPGRDLAEVQRQYARPLDPELVRDWGLQLCEVLTYLHGQTPPIVFRDLKPSNIMLRGDGQLALVDFGIAKHFQTIPRGTMIGTEGYAPPEQYEGISDPRVDIYGLGATLHHLLTNTNPQQFRPFSFNSRPVGTYNPAVSPALEAAMTRALAYEPGERWQSANEMAAALGGGRNAAAAPRARTGLLRSDAPSRGAAAGMTRSLTPPSNGVPAAPVAVSGRLQSPALVNAIEPLWRFVCEDEVRSSPVVHRGKLFIGSYDHHLYCLDAWSGQCQWKFKTAGGIPGTPALYEHTVIVGSEDHAVYAVSMRSGVREWSFTTQGRVRSSPRIAQDQLFVGSDDGNVYALSLPRATQLWKSTIGAPVRSSAGLDGNQVLIGSEDGGLYSLDPITGQQRWRVQMGGPVVSSPAVSDNRVVVGSFDWTVYAVDPSSGWVIWRFRTGDMVIASPTLVNNRVYIGSVDGSLTCLDADWGNVLWRQRLGGQITSSAAVANDCVYVGCVDGALYCLSAQNGRHLWRFETDGPIPGSPLVAGNTVYIGSTDRTVYALRATPA